MDRLRHLSLAAALAGLLAACTEEAPSAPTPRFAGVSAATQASAMTRFCDHVYPAAGSDARRYSPPAERPIAGYAPPAERPGLRWKWVNLWATWCGPCVAEMPLLARWQGALATDGHAIELELVSIDEDEAALGRWVKQPRPGRVRWLASHEALGPFLRSLGLDESSAIPIHALVDPSGNLRCVRVGSVSESDFGTIKSMISDGPR